MLLWLGKASAMARREAWLPMRRSSSMAEGSTRSKCAAASPRKPCRQVQEAQARVACVAGVVVLMRLEALDLGLSAVMAACLSAGTASRPCAQQDAALHV